MNNYTPVGDLIVSSVCLVMIVLLFFSYNRHTRSFRIFLALIGLLILAANTNVSFYMLVTTGDPRFYFLAYFLRWLYHGFLFTILFFYVAYIIDVTRMERREKRIAFSAAGGLWLIVVATDAVETITGTGIKITGQGVINRGMNLFLYGYLAFVLVIIILLINVRNNLYRNVMLSFYGTILMAFFVLFLQGECGQTSFTAASFLYPLIGMFYIMHSSPYDAQIGAVDSRAFEDMVRESLRRKSGFAYMSLYMRNINEGGKVPPEEMYSSIRAYATNSFKGGLLFQVGKGHSILVAQKEQNPDYKDRIRDAIDGFYDEYAKFRFDYKIVIGESVDAISRKNQYVSLIDDVHQHMEENSIHTITGEDIDRFRRTLYILGQLDDIHKKHDLDDPRVLAYCQPVYNIRTKRYDTAEALMRLNLDVTGVVYPDQFIALAEKNDQIHVLTEIILYKTCREIKKLIAAGKKVTRVSVNVSALELKDEHFCDDINRIIDESGIPGDKIAIELTESQTEDDCILMKVKIDQLKERGIKFYLDDFGTGYSNMERIMELPFDIIKFDRSLLLASDSNERSRTIVSSLANMFARMKYSVLYEGVEREDEERMCIDMDASFLQGYKYSRPVPIEELDHFFEKAEWSLIL